LVSSSWQTTSCSIGQTLLRLKHDALQNDEVLSVHGAMNKLGVQSLRFVPRSVVRGLAAKLNRSVP